MVVMPKKRLPRFRSRREVAEFFETRDPADYVPLQPDSIALPPELERRILAQQETRPVTLRLNQWMIEAAKEIGRKSGVPYQVLIKLWIAEGIHRKARLLGKRVRAKRKTA